MGFKQRPPVNNGLSFCSNNEDIKQFWQHGINLIQKFKSGLRPLETNNFQVLKATGI